MNTHIDLSDPSVFNDSLNTMWEIVNIHQQLDHAGMMYDIDKLIEDYTDYLDKLKRSSVSLPFDSSLTTIS